MQLIIDRGLKNQEPLHCPPSATSYVRTEPLPPCQLWSWLRDELYFSEEAPAVGPVAPWYLPDSRTSQTDYRLRSLQLARGPVDVIVHG